MNTIQGFYKKIAELQGQIDSSDQAAKRLVSLFETELEQVNLRFKDAHKKLKKKHGESPTVKFVSELSGQITNSLEAWKKNQAKAIKGEQLRNIAKDSLLIIIYGKVKAGKSTLGNFVAQNSPKEISPQFFVFDHAGEQNKIPKLEELDEDSFATKTTECTSSIQGFKIPGLIWIDTPGLASMTSENGQLAKEYIEAADLIIYPMTSDSPGRRTDVEELHELAKAGKDFAVLITKSDINDEDEVDGEIVQILKNKTVENREKQEAWVQKEILKKLSEVSTAHGTSAENQLLGKILSISVMVAREYSQNSKEWEQSNIPTFYGMLNEILERDAIRLRISQPLKKVSSFLRESLLNKENPNSLIQRINALQELQNNLRASANLLKEKQVHLVCECTLMVDFPVREMVMLAKQENWSAKVIAEKISKIVQEQVFAIIQPRATEILSIFCEKLDAEFPLPNLDVDGLDLGDKTRTITITNEIVTRNTGSATGGVLGMFLGAFVAAVFAPVTGGGSLVALGISATVGLAGRAVGSKVGEGLASTSQKEITVGDNLQEVEDRAVQLAEQGVKSSIKEVLSGFEKEIVHPMSSVISEMQKDLKETIKNIESELKT